MRISKVLTCKISILEYLMRIKEEDKNEREKKKVSINSKGILGIFESF